MVANFFIGLDELNPFLKAVKKEETQISKQWTHGAFCLLGAPCIHTCQSFQKLSLQDVFFSLKLTANAPENGWLADDRFLLGPGLLAMSFETRGFAVSVEAPDSGLKVFKVSFSSQRVDVVFCPPPPPKNLRDVPFFLLFSPGFFRGILAESLHEKSNYKSRGH